MRMKGLWVRVATMVVGTTVAQMNTEISGVREDKNLPTEKNKAGPSTTTICRST